MSEIPFVNRLGDEIEQAAAARIATRRSRIRRRLVVGAVGFAVAASGVAAASGVFSSADQLAANAVGCYDRPSLNANVSVLSTGEDSPVDTCRRVMHTDRPLVACMGDGHVAVFPGGAQVCEKLGLAPLPAGYTPARAKVNAFARDVQAIETSADCIPPRALERRVQALLDRTPGWSGWRTWLRLDVESGPCGSVTSIGGDGSRTIEGSLDADGHRVMVFGSPSRSTIELLNTPEGPGNRLIDASGERCYTIAGLHDLARRRLGETGRTLTFSAVTADENVEIMDARGRRLKEGCAVIVGLAPTPDDRGIVVELWH